MRKLLEATVVVLVAICSTSAGAQERQFGDWHTGALDDGSGGYAGTINDSGGLLTVFCYKEGNACIWSLVVDLNCEQDATYPVLVNADNGAASSEVVCRKIRNDKPGYVFKNFALIDSSVRKSQRIGFAAPLQSGQFNVSRFSLKGATQALDFLSRLMSVMRNASDEGTVDQAL